MKKMTILYIGKRKIFTKENTLQSIYMHITQYFYIYVLYIYKHTYTQ